ncbi:protein ILITYHIA [Pelomyxa schiedti]|nr:protein ILITYHIA [Pelomyxa schiedti]
MSSDESSPSSAPKPAQPQPPPTSAPTTAPPTTTHQQQQQQPEATHTEATTTASSSLVEGELDQHQHTHSTPTPPTAEAEAVSSSSPSATEHTTSSTTTTTSSSSSSSSKGKREKRRGGGGDSAAAAAAVGQLRPAAVSSCCVAHAVGSSSVPARTAALRTLVDTLHAAHAPHPGATTTSTSTSASSSPGCCDGDSANSTASSSSSSGGGVAAAAQEPNEQAGGQPATASTEIDLSDAAQLIIGTLSFYSDRISRCHSMQAFTTLAQIYGVKFSKEFLTLAGGTPNFDFASSSILFTWSCYLDDGGDPLVFEKIAQLQCHICNILANPPAKNAPSGQSSRTTNICTMNSNASMKHYERCRNSAFKSFISMIHKIPLQVVKYIEFLKERLALSLSTKYCAIYSLLIESCATLPEVLAKHKTHFIKVYKDLILNAPANQPKSTETSFNVLLHTLSCSDLDTIFPDLSRLLKRDTESTLLRVINLLENVQGDLSSIAIQVEAILTAVFKLPGANLHSLATIALEKLLILIKQPDVHRRFLDVLIEPLTDPRATYLQKMSSIKSTLVFCKPTTIQVINTPPVEIITALIEKITTFQKKETMEDLLAACTEAVGVWCGVVPDNVPMPSNGVTLLKQYIAPTATVSTARSLSLCSAIASSLSTIRTSTQEAKIAQAISLLEPLKQQLLVLTRTAKTAPLPLIGIFNSISNAASCSAIKSHLMNCGLWPVIFGANSIIWESAFISRLDVPQCLDLVIFVESLLRYHLSVLEDSTFSSNFYMLTIWLMSHPSWEVRCHCLEVIKLAHRANPKMTMELLTALMQTLEEYATGIKKTTPPPAKALRDCLLWCVSGSILGQGVAQAFIAAHHPLLRIPDTPPNWPAIGFQIDCGNGVSVLVKYANFVCTSIVEGLVTRVPGDNIFQAARDGLEFMCRVAPDLVTTHVLPQLLLKADFARISEMSQKELQFYQSPPGILFLDEEEKRKRDQEQVAVKPPVKVQSEKKKRGEGRMYRVEDEQWELQYRQEQAQKLAEEKALKDSKADALLLEKQNKEREAISKKLAPFFNCVNILTGLATTHPKLIIEYSAAILDKFTPSMNHILVRKDIRTMLETIMSHLPAPLHSISHSWFVLFMSLLGRGSGKVDIASLENRLINFLGDTLVEPLPPHLFSFILPVLSVILRRAATPSDLRAQASAVKILCLHVQSGPAYPRIKIGKLLVHLMLHTPRFVNRARTSLIALCIGMNLDDISAIGIEGLHSTESHVREAFLNGLLDTPCLMAGDKPEAVTTLLWMAMGDPEPENVSLAHTVWMNYNTSLPHAFFEHLKKYLGSEKQFVRTLAANGIFRAVTKYKNTADATVRKLFDLYHQKLKKEKTVCLDSKDSAHTLLTRCGVMETLGCLGVYLTEVTVREVFDFLLGKPVSDHPDVGATMVKAGLAICESNAGSSHHKLLIAMLAPNLRKVTSNPAQERLKECSVIFTGSLASYLDPKSPEVALVVNQLLGTLRSGASEDVLQAVGECFSSLGTVFLSDTVPTPTIAQKLVTSLNSGNTSEQRGAAYGVAGIVEGMGFMAIRTLSLMPMLISAVTNKSKTSKLGALFALELISNGLGRMFEPYSISVVPHILTCYGDVPEVRDAAGRTAKAIMGQLTHHGVRLLLPALITGTQDPSWMIKKKSADLLGALSYCAPQVLSECLPQIVPCLIDVETFPQLEVQKSAREALTHISSVIKNPEIETIASILLAALTDNTKTHNGLEALEQLNFTYSIDAPALAIIAPILVNGLKDRSAETKKKAAQIIGNLSHICAQQDLVYYLPTLKQPLTNALIDPNPEVRSLTARAFGSLMSELGEQPFPGLLNRLLELLVADVGIVEKSGAAQGLAEMFSVLDITRLDGVLPGVISKSEDPQVYVRQGALLLIRFLPVTMRDKLNPYIATILPPVLNGLADQTEVVRDVALKAGNTIVSTYHTSALNLLVPALENGVFDDNWRIQESSVVLLGDLLTNLLQFAKEKPVNAEENSETESQEAEENGESEESEESEEETKETAQSSVVAQALGDRCNDVLSALYLVRFDANITVTQKAALIWKTVVDHPSKALIEILPTLMSRILTFLSSSSKHRKTLGTAALGDIVERLADRVIPVVMPILQQRLNDPSTTVRQGACLGLAEIIRAGRNMISSFAVEVTPAIEKALCDSDESVRETAAGAFNRLYQVTGGNLLDTILPPILKDMKDPSKFKTALSALKQVVQARSGAVLPLVVPKLTKIPVSVHNSVALIGVLEEAGDAIRDYLSAALSSLVKTMVIAPDQEILESALRLMLLVTDTNLPALFSEMTKHLNSDSDEIKMTALHLLSSYFGTADPTQPALFILSDLLNFLNNPDPVIYMAAGDVVTQLLKNCRKELQGSYLETARRVLSTLSESATELPGLSNPNGFEPLSQLFRQTIASGADEVKETAAVGLGELLRLSSSAAIMPSSTAIVGPLIRTMGERINWQTKAAILQTMCIALDKVAPALGGFVSMLQGVFLKNLHDPAKIVRMQAAEAVGKLAKLNPKLERLFSELITGLSSSDEYVDAEIVALSLFLAKTITPPDSTILSKLPPILVSLLGATDDSQRQHAARAYAHHMKFLPPEEFSKLLKLNPLFDYKHVGSLALQQRQARERIIGTLLLHATKLVVECDLTIFPAIISTDFTGETVSLQTTACWSAGIALSVLPKVAGPALATPIVAKLVPGLIGCLNDSVSEVKIAALEALSQFAVNSPEEFSPHRNAIALKAFSLRAGISPIRIAMDRLIFHTFRLTSQSQSQSTTTSTTSTAAADASTTATASAALIDACVESAPDPTQAALLREHCAALALRMSPATAANVPFE